MVTKGQFCDCGWWGWNSLSIGVCYLKAALLEIVMRQWADTTVRFADGDGEDKEDLKFMILRSKRYFLDGRRIAAEIVKRRAGHRQGTMTLAAIRG